MNEFNDYHTNSVVSTVIPLSLPDDIFNNECGTKINNNNNKQKKEEKKVEKEEEKKEKEPQKNQDKTDQDQSIEFENAINTILDNIMYLEIKTICDDIKELMISRDCKSNLKLIEILIDSIILHGVNSNPKFFAAKYSLLFQSILSYLIQNDGVNDIDELHELIWICCYDTFKKLQFGNDSNKFINITIIIAELFNANLLTSYHIFTFVFKSILNTNNLQEICENDIEGIYEIFKRCHRSLNNKTNRKELQKYLNLMNKIKIWHKFQNGMKRVPFMSNQMQQTVNP